MDHFPSTAVGRRGSKAAGAIAGPSPNGPTCVWARDRGSADVPPDRRVGGRLNASERELGHDHGGDHPQRGDRGHARPRRAPLGPGAGHPHQSRTASQPAGCCSCMVSGGVESLLDRKAFVTWSGHSRARRVAIALVDPPPGVGTFRDVAEHPDVAAAVAAGLLRAVPFRARVRSCQAGPLSWCGGSPRFPACRSAAADCGGRTIRCAIWPSRPWAG